MDKLLYKECENCSDWNGDICLCMEICYKPINALREFNEYYQIGTPDECRIAKEKMKPMELHHARINKEPVKTRDSVCPSCLGVTRTALNEFPNYCSNCGQALKWGD